MTLRELEMMANSRGDEEWKRTAAMLAMLYNMNRDPAKGKAVMAEEFNPYSKVNRAKPVISDRKLNPDEVAEVLNKG